MSTVSEKNAAYCQNSRSTRGDFWPLVLLFLAINLHLLRNISAVYYVVILGLWSLVLVANRFSLKRSAALEWYSIFSASFIFVAIVSLLQFSFANYYSDAIGIFVGLGRMLFIIPIALLAAGRRWNAHEIAVIIKIFALFVAIGALSVPLQYLTGPVHWFAAASERGGFDRFASLFGNLTALGIVAGLGLIATVYSSYSRAMKALIVGATVLGLLLSLQKAAVANTIVAGVLLAFYYPATLSLKLRYLGYSLSIGACLVAALYLTFGDVALATLSNFRLSSGGDGFDDYTVVESVTQRVVELPLHAVNHYGWTVVLWGVGLVGSAGVAGFEEAPMAHNQLVDLVLMGGVMMLLLFVAMFWAVYRKMRRPNRAAGRLSLLHYWYVRTTLIYILINLPFASGVIFQPNVGAIFWLMVGVIISGYFGRPKFGA